MSDYSKVNLTSELNCFKSETKREQGFSLIESLMSLLISGLVMAASVSSFLSLSRFSQDNELRTVSQLKAQAVLDMITPDIRMLGNGVPFHQPNFLIAQQTLSDKTVTEPIRTTSTEKSIVFRLNETGETYILTQDLDPTASTDVFLTSINKIKANQHIYITNSTIGEDDGLWAEVSSVSTSQSKVVLKSGAQYHPGALFPKGSLLEVVPVVNYYGDNDFGEVVRNNGEGNQILVNNGKVSFTYLNSNGDPISLPLVASSGEVFPASAIQNVHAVKIQVQVRSSRQLSGTDDYYISKVSKTVGVRNLNFKY